MPFSFNPFKPFTKSSARRRVTQLAGQDAEATPDQAAAQRVVRKDTEEASFESLFSKAQHLLLQARSEAAQATDRSKFVRTHLLLQQCVQRMAELVASMPEATRVAWQMRLQPIKGAVDALTPSGQAAVGAPITQSTQSNSSASSLSLPPTPQSIEKYATVLPDAELHRTWRLNSHVKPSGELQAIKSKMQPLYVTQSAIKGSEAAERVKDDRKRKLMRELEEQRAFMLTYERALSQSWGGPGQTGPMSLTQSQRTEVEQSEFDFSLIADIEHLEAQRSVPVARNRSGASAAGSSRDEATWEAEAIAATRHAELRTQLMFLTGGTKRLKGDVEELRKALRQAEQQLQQSEQSVEDIRTELRSLPLPMPPQYAKLQHNIKTALYRTQ